MIKTIINAFKIADIRKKLLFTAFIILIFRIGSVIPVPFVNIVDEIDVGKGNTIMTYLSLMTGSAFTYGTIFAMSITPYINSSIIIQLLTVAIPALENLQKEGEEGRKKITAITRFLTVALGLLQSLAYFFYLRSQNLLSTDASGAAFTGFDAVFQAVVIIAVLTAGTAVIMWLGEQITIQGIGNGISIILFAGIASRFPTIIKQLFQYLSTGRTVYKVLVPVVCVVFILMIAYIVLLDNAERKLPIQYAKRVVGRKMYGGQSSVIPIKISGSGVMPLIFAFAIISAPQMIISVFFSYNQDAVTGVTNWFSGSSPFWYGQLIYMIVLCVLIFAFSFFYQSMQFNPEDVSKTIQQNGGFIQGIRPGKPTADYLKKISNRITLFGAIYLTLVAFIPSILSMILTGLGQQNLSLLSVFSTTGILIVVSVAMELDKQLESQLMMKNYKGFLK